MTGSARSRDSGYAAEQSLTQLLGDLDEANMPS